MRQAIVGLLAVLFGPLVLPVGRYFMTSAPDLLWRGLALAVLVAGWLILGLSPTVYPWLRNPAQHAILSTSLVAIAGGSIAALSWLLFAVKIASPDFVVSVFRAYYEPTTLTFSADVAYMNRSQSQRTVVGTAFTFHEKGYRRGGARCAPPGRDTILGDIHYIYVEPGKTVTEHYTEKIEPRDFNAIALIPSGKTKGEVEGGLQFAILNLEGQAQTKCVFFMEVYVDEGICELRMFQPKRVSLDMPGDVFLN